MAQKKKALRDAEKEAYWRHKLDEWKRSGLSQAAFCRREELNANTFSSWKTIIPERDAEQKVNGRSERTAPQEKPSFVRVEVDTNDGAQPSPSAHTNSRAKPLEQPPELTVAAELVDSKNGYRVHIFNGADSSTLSALVAALTSNPSRNFEF